MCRILTSDLRGLNKVGKNYMKSFLDTLETSCGGHSNGYLAIKNGEIIEFKKSCTLTNQEIVDDIYNIMPDWFIYHTRIASKGSIKDSNAHPYVNEDKTFGLCMNGTMSDFGAISTKMDITDTELLFRMMDKLDLPPEYLVDLSPRFMGIKNGKVFASNGDSHDPLQFDDENCIIIASEFPIDYPYNSKTMKKSSCWNEGETIEEETVKVYSYNRYLQNYYNDDYSWWYDYKAKQDKNEIDTKKNKEEDIQEDGVNENIQEFETVHHEYDLIDAVDYGREMLTWQMNEKDIEEELVATLGNNLDKLKTKEGYYEIKIGKNNINLLNDTKEVIY